MSLSHQDAVHSQFDPQANAYRNSAVHAHGPDLEWAQELVTGLKIRPESVLDVGCGGGHLSFALAPLTSRIVALDASDSMLTAVRTTATDSGLDGLSVVRADAATLPFPDCSFDLVATRYSTHHWTYLPRGLSEMVRVLRPNGHFLVIDTQGYEDPLIDTHFQTMELLRDRSHVRNRSHSEWCALLDQCGIRLLQSKHWPLRLEFAAWVERMRTPPDRVSMIRTLQQEAPNEVCTALSFEEDGSFTARTGLWWGQRPA